MQWYGNPGGCLRVWKRDDAEYRIDSYDESLSFENVSPQIIRLDGLKGEMNMDYARAIMAEAKRCGVKEIHFERIKNGRARLIKLKVR